jgi:hypothetical protein
VVRILRPTKPGVCIRAGGVLQRVCVARKKTGGKYGAININSGSNKAQIVRKQLRVLNRTCWECYYAPAGRWRPDYVYLCWRVESRQVVALAVYPNTPACAEFKARENNDAG